MATKRPGSDVTEASVATEGVPFNVVAETPPAATPAIAKTIATTLVGRNTSQMRRAAARLIRQTPGHPLSFLLGPNGRFRSTRGLSHAELIDDPCLVQMGHITSNKAGFTERIMLQGAWENQFNAVTTETTSKGETYVENVAIDIGGIAVDRKTAVFWENNGFIAPGTVAKAPLVLP